MATMGPEDRERFARKEDAEVTTAPSARQGSWRDRSPRVLLGGSLAEVACGAATVVLAILALTGTMPGYLVPIATIVLGVALLAHGGAVAARLRALSAATGAAGWDMRPELGGGTGAELIGGAAGVVLGILALVGIDTVVLTLVGLLALGSALVLSGTTVSGRMAAILRR